MGVIEGGVESRNHRYSPLLEKAGAEEKIMDGVRIFPREEYMSASCVRDRLVSAVSIGRALSACGRMCNALEDRSRGAAVLDRQSSC